MRCKFCDNTEFTLIDGVSCCTVCVAQVQSSIQQKSDREDGSAIRSKKKKTKEKLYDDWTSPEAYSVILRKQTVALMNHGASNQLKDVVLYIWCQYLQKCEIAFRVDYMAETTIPRLGAFAVKRDIKVLYGNKTVGKKHKAKKKKNAKQKEPISLTSDTEIQSSTEYGHSFLTESDTNYTPSDGYESLNESKENVFAGEKKVNFSSFAKKYLKQKKFTDTFGAKKRFVHELSLYKTLCICYLGLLHTRDNLLLSDMLRLVKDRKIPFLYVHEHLPSSMHLLYGDFNAFKKTTVPDLWDISHMAAKLVDFLKLPKFKHRPLMPIVIRFVMDLNLPSCIIPIVKNIIDMLKEEENQWYEIERKSKRCIKPIPMYEAQAMASIIVALKLLFVLDGEYEMEHSEIMMKINILLKSDKLFVWNEWRQQLSLKDFLFMKSGASCSDLSNLDKLSSEFIAKYSSVQPTLVNHNQSNAAKAKKEIQNQLKHLLNFNISESLEVTSFPIKSQQASMISNWKKWNIFKDTKEIDFTFLSKDFSSRLFFYDYEESDQSTEELINILLSSLYESVELRTWCNLALTRENILRTTSKYWFKNFPPRKFSVSGWIEELPDSFTWLLKFLSKYIHISCKYLYTEVLNIEKKLFLHVKRAHFNKKL